MKNTPQNIAFDSIQPETTVRFSRLITEKDVNTFAQLSRDMNPLHTESLYATGTQFKKPVAHGKFLASFFSELIGMRMPGKHSLYLSQSLIFKKPVYIGDEVVVEGRVVSKSLATQSVEIETRIYVNNECAVEGVARVQII